MPYIYVHSKEELGAAGQTKRPTSPPRRGSRLPSPPVAMESRIAIALIAVALLCGAAPAVAQTKTQITVRRARPSLRSRCQPSRL